MYKQDLASNKLEGLICHKTQPTYKLLPCKFVQTNDGWTLTVTYLYLKPFNCVQKKNSAALKNVIYKIYKSYLIYMYKQDMVLNNLKVLICHKTLTN